MMQYLQEHPTEGDRKFSLSYKNLYHEYMDMVAMTDEEFVANLPRALHLACIIAWLKELDLDRSVGDYGVIHMLAHYLHMPDDTNLAEVREIFRKELILSF